MKQKQYELHDQNLWPHSFGPDEKEKCDPYTALMACLLFEV